MRPSYEEVTALPRWESVYNPHSPRTIHTRNGSEDRILIPRSLFSRESIGDFTDRPRSVNSVPEEKENPRRSKLMLWLILCLVVLLVLAIVLGAVLGTYLNESSIPPAALVTNASVPSNSPTSTSSRTPSSTSSKVHILSTPTASVRAAPITVAGWSAGSSEEHSAVALFWQDSRGYLSKATLNTTSGNWTHVSNFVKAKLGTPLTAAVFNTEDSTNQSQSGPENAPQHQIHVVYLDDRNRLNEWVFTEDGPSLGQAGTLNYQLYMAHNSTQLASYGPNILYQGMSGEVREVSFTCYGKGQCWNDRVLGTTQPVNGSRLTMVPTQKTNPTVGLFYQDEDGRYLNYVEDDERKSSVWANGRLIPAVGGYLTVLISRRCIFGPNTAQLFPVGIREDSEERRDSVIAEYVPSLAIG